MARLTFFILVVIASLMRMPASSAADADLLTPQERTWLAAHPDLVLGAGDGWHPNVSKGRDGELRGFLADHLKLLNQKLGSNIRIEVGPWAEMVRKAEAGQIAGLTLTAPLDERKANFDFTVPFMKVDVMAFLRTEDKAREGGTKKLGDLNGKRVGYLKGVKRIRTVFDVYPLITPVAFENYDVMVSALLDGSIDAILDAISLENWKSENRQGGFTRAFIVPEAEGRMVMSIRKDYPELVSILNKALASLTTAELLPIYQHWYGLDYADYTGALVTSLSDEEQTWLAAHPVIRVSADTQWAPIEFKDKEGKPQGMSISYLNRIGRELGIRFEFDNANSWSDSLHKLMSKEIDLLPAIVADDERRKMMRFTDPYLTVPAAVFSATEAAYLGSINGLKDKRVLVIKDEAVESWLRSNWPELALTPVADTKEALKQLVMDPNAAFVGNLITTSYYIGQTKQLNVKVAGETSFTYQLSMAVRDDWPLFASILQKGLNAIPIQERDRIYNDWISIRYDQHVDRRTLWIILGVAVLTLLVIFFERSFRLKKINTRLRQLAADISQIEERERQRLATELHDSPLQKLALAQMQLSSASLQIPPSPTNRMQTGLSLMREAMDELHTLQFELSPPMLYREGLCASLDWLANHATKRFGIAMTFVASSSTQPITQDLSVLLFQCARELVYNIAKHARATSGEITLAFDQKTVTLSVSDNGVGFESDDFQPRPGGGFGLYNLRERVALVGGKLVINQSLGCKICITVPATSLCVGE